ncbi:MAG: HAMP domain-containing histidine kinase [Leptospiraceae bacterium]|nr:HAMP domain-containing histidine kinase [Leptospiraceae bacterium]
MKTYQKIFLLHSCSLGLLAILTVAFVQASPFAWHKAGPLISPDMLVELLDQLTPEQRRNFYHRSHKTNGLIWFETNSNNLTNSSGGRFALKLPSQRDPGRVYILRADMPLRRRFHPGFIVAPFIFFLMLASGALIVRALKPLSDLTNDMRLFGAGRAEIRYRGPMRGQETKQLAIAFNDMADQIDQARQRDRLLLRSITHELRNPIMALRWGFELYRRNPEPERLHQLDKIIHSLEKSMAEVRIVTDSIMNKRNEAIEYESIDLHEFLRRFIEEQKPFFAQQSRPIELVAGPERAPAVVHTDSLSVILKNLARNFLQHEPERIPMRLELRRLDETWSICVRTSIKGRLIGGVAHKNAFIRPVDSRAHSASPGKPGSSPESMQSSSADQAATGTGIGLSIAVMLAENMGWQLRQEGGLLILQARSDEA